MIRAPLIRWLLANLIGIGLALSPFSAAMPSAAMTPPAAITIMAHGSMVDMPHMSGTSMSDMTAGSDAAAMSDAKMAVDMPCCPDTQKGECTDCPFVAICMLKISSAQPVSANGLPSPPTRHELFVAFDDFIADGMNRPPPDQPPRILA